MLSHGQSEAVKQGLYAKPSGVIYLDAVHTEVPTRTVVSRTLHHNSLHQHTALIFHLLYMCLTITTFILIFL